jgi:hypothetical protein
MLPPLRCSRYLIHVTSAAMYDLSVPVLVQWAVIELG